VPLSGSLDNAQYTPLAQVSPTEPLAPVYAALTDEDYQEIRTLDNVQYLQLVQVTPTEPIAPVSADVTEDYQEIL